MNTHDLAVKCIREGVKYADENTSHHRKQFEDEDVACMASSLSVGLITLTEERLKEIIKEAFTKGFWCRSAGYRFDIPALPYASRIIEALKKEGKGGRDEK